MGMKRSSGTARLEEQLIQEWKRYAARQAGSAEEVAKGACYLESRPCPFEARPDFETRFAKDCVHCPRLQGALERTGPAPTGPPGVLPTMGLLIRLVEADPEVAIEDREEDGRYRAAALLLRSLPLLHASSNPRRTARILLAAVAGAFNESVDTLLFFDVAQDATALTLGASYRQVDLDVPALAGDGRFDVEALESAGAFDSSVFDRLREAPIPLDQDRDLLADAVYDGRTAVVQRPSHEVRLPTRLVEHLPDGPVAILPVFGRERVNGLLVVSAGAGVAGWTADQIELLSAAVTQAGIALEGSTLLGLARRRGAGLRALGELGAAEVGTTRSEPWSDSSLQAILTAVAADAVVVWERGESGAFAVAASAGAPMASAPDLLETGEALLHWFEADPRPILVDPRRDPPMPSALPAEWAAALAVPLRGEGSLRGAILLARKASGAEAGEVEPFDAEDENVATLAACVSTLGELRVADGEALARSERRSGELEAQLRHADKLAVVGERGILVAQEIRNPISAITGFARRVLRTLRAGDENREFLEIILRETERLERILTEQVAMAQMARPRLKLQSLNALVQEVLELQSEELVRRRVRLLKRLSPDLPSLLIDAEKMRQVLVNVLQHALQAVPSGGRVRVETRTGTGVVHAEVAHDGPKVAGESLDRLFVPFHSSRRYGAGVGLAVAYQIVREHGGEIRARSEGDWSSIVTIYLPVKENQDRRGKPDRRGGKNDRRRRLA